MLSVATRAPLAVGLNVTSMVQLAPPAPDDHSNSVDFREKTTFLAFTSVGQWFRDAAPCAQLAFKFLFFDFLPIIHAVNYVSARPIATLLSLLPSA